MGTETAKPGLNGLGEILSIARTPVSSDWMAVREAVEALDAHLREGNTHPETLREIGDCLEQLSVYPKWEVRKEVAHASESLPYPAFYRVITQLLEDENAWVQETARRALAQRTDLTGPDPLKAQHDVLLRGWLSGLAAKGPKVRETAVAVAEKYAELLFRETYHEIIRILSPLEHHLDEVEDALRQPKIAREVCLDRTRRVKDRIRLLISVVMQMHDLTSRVVPEFRGERLRALVTDAVDLVRDRKGAVDLSLTLDIDRRIVLDAHRYRIVQAFANLVENAIESYEGLDRPRTLNVAAKVHGTEVVVTFSDEGCGMAEDAIAEVFLLFSTTKRASAGVGLPLAQKIIQAEHRGRIWIESKPGTGTTVSVVLPLEQRSALEDRS